MTEILSLTVFLEMYLYIYLFADRSVESGAGRGTFAMADQVQCLTPPRNLPLTEALGIG
jgi:hypothetical protein